MHVAVRCTVGEAERVSSTLTSLGWGTQWIDEPLVQSTNDDGYVLGQAASGDVAVVHAWPSREGETLEPPTEVCGHAVACVDDEHDASVDWTVAWREAFPSRVEIVPGVVLATPWSKPLDGERALVIEPMAAFGTGLHPTTVASLRSLHERVRPGDRVLDVGTGSGVLAIAAVLWGAGEVVAIDVDDVCADALATNLRWNGLAPERVRFAKGDLDAMRGKSACWDIVLCNIGAAELMRSLPSLESVVANGGHLIGSGIWSPSLERVRRAAEQRAFVSVSEQSAEGWHTVTWRRG
jgi:ribosomal protein L11 methyltransferase